MKVVMGATEPINNLLIFLRFCRARTIDQAPARPQETADRLQQDRLSLMMRRQRGRLFMPFAFRVSAKHAEPAAGRIQQDAIELEAGGSPVGGRRPKARSDDCERITGHEIAHDRRHDRDPETPAIVTDQAHPWPTPINREDLAPVSHEGREMGGLPSRSGAGIQHSFAWLGIEQERN
jgi:hypothetical protein